MKVRAFIQVSVAAIVLFVLFGAIHDPTQAKTNSYTPVRTLEKRTTLVDSLTMAAIVPANRSMGPSVFNPPLQGDRSNPSIGPDRLIQLTIVVIVMSAGVGAVGTRLTRAVPPGAGSD